MKQIPLYPLRFEPIFQYRLWGGRRLAAFLTAPLPASGPVGEAWILSDRDDFPSRVANGALKGSTLKELIDQFPSALLGKLSGLYSRFPLLLKLLDVSETLSVQVHPSDNQTSLIPAGEHGKTEAWVVLEPGISARTYAGLEPGTTEQILHQAVSCDAVADHLTSFEPIEGDVVMIPARTVHALSDVVVFEVQENSDVTFRLYDWNHIDSRTGQPRPLQVEQALACIDYAQGRIGPVEPVIEAANPVLRELLLRCEHFVLWRICGVWPFVVGEEDTPRVIVCIAGEGELKFGGKKYSLSTGDVLILPAVVGACTIEPQEDITVLEIAIPVNS